MYCQSKGVFAPRIATVEFGAIYVLMQLCSDVK